MLNTPTWQIPYPESGDHTRTWEYWQGIAARVDACLSQVAQPAVVQVRQTVVQSIPNNLAAYTALTFDVEDTDPLDMHTSGNPTRLTCKVAGLYRLAGAACMAGNVTGYRRLGWWVNGGNTPHTVTVIQPGVNLAVSMIASSLLVQLAVNDYAELRVFQDSGAALNTAVGNGNQSWASMEYIRP